MNALKSFAWRRPLTWRAMESRADELAFTRDNTMLDELGLDAMAREWQSLAALGTFWSKYRNAGGCFYPFFETEAQLDNLRSRCRIVGDVFPNAIGVLENLVNYTVGTGYKFQIQPIERGQEKDLCKQAQTVIDEFLERSDFTAEMDRELFATWRQDGDIFAGIYDLGDGFADMRQILPEYVTEPNDPRAIEDWIGDSRASDWSFGIRTAFGDTQRVYGYYVQWSQNPGDFDYFDAADMVHAKLNVRRSVKRGLSDFHGVLVWLHRQEKLMKNTAVGAAVQASIAYIEEYADGVMKSDAQDIAFGQSAYTYQVDGGETRYAQQTEPGQVKALSPGVKFVAGPSSSEKNGNFLQVSQAITRLIGCRWSMPEYLISSDASNANYASTMVAESPWVKATEARQAQFGRVQTRLLWRVIELALRAGRIRSMHAADLTELKRYIKIVATAPQAAVRDRGQETDRYDKMAKGGILSDKTWAEKEGLDYEEELQNGAAKEMPPAPVLPPGADGKEPAATPEQLAAEFWKGYP